LRRIDHGPLRVGCGETQKLLPLAVEPVAIVVRSASDELIRRRVEHDDPGRRWRE